MINLKVDSILLEVKFGWTPIHNGTMFLSDLNFKRIPLMDLFDDPYQEKFLYFQNHLKKISADMTDILQDIMW